MPVKESDRGCFCRCSVSSLAMSQDLVKKRRGSLDCCEFCYGRMRVWGMGWRMVRRRDLFMYFGDESLGGRVAECCAKECWWRKCVKLLKRLKSVC